jgi:hypothetical protein
MRVSAKSERGFRARIARLFHRDRRVGAGPDEPVQEPLSMQVPDEVEWDQSLIGIEPHSGEVAPPTIC